MANLDPRKQHEMEQGIASMRDIFPPLWWGLYLGCISQGFTPTQSFDLIKTYIISQGSGNKLPPPSDSNQPNPPQEE